MHDGLKSLQSLVLYMDPPLHAHLQQCAPDADADWLFCYRWLLLDFKREFDVESILCLWERIWSQHSTSHFHIFFAMGILQSHREQLLRISREDDLLKYLQDLTMHIDMVGALDRAQAALRRLKADNNMPLELRPLVTPSDGGTFVPPPRVGFVRYGAW